MATPEAKELALVGKVELRIALAETDAKLETVLNTYLAPLLLKLASEHLSVRNKVISICQHVNSRTKLESVRLPVAALLKQFKANPATALIRHFDLLYIQKGIGRLSATDRSELLSTIVNGISTDAAGSAIHGATLFHMMLRILHAYPLPPKASKENTDFRETLGLSDEDAQFLSMWLGKLLLLRVVAKPVERSTASPGLSPQEYSFLTLHGKPEAWDPSTESGLSLTDTKVLAVNLLASGLFRNAERLLPATFASADPNSRLSDIGEDLLKRTLSELSLEDPAIVEKLYETYFGRPATAGEDQSLVISPPRLPIRIKILSLLARSEISSNYPNLVVRVVHEGLAESRAPAEEVPTSTSLFRPNRSGTAPQKNREISKLRAQLVTLILFVTRKSTPGNLDAISQTLIQELQRFADRREDDAQSFDGTSLRGRCFEVIGLLAGASRKTLEDANFSVLKWLFASLGEESAKDVIVSIDEALSVILGSFTMPNDLVAVEELEQLLLGSVHRPSKNERNTHFAAVRFANRCLPYDNVVARWIDLLTLARGPDESHETVEEARKGLDPHWYELQRHARHAYQMDTTTTGLSFPQLTALVDNIFVKHHEDDVLETVRPFAVSYCRQVLIWEALRSVDAPVDLSVDWERKLDSAVTSDPKLRENIRKYYKSASSNETLSTTLGHLWQAALQGMVADETGGKAECGRVFLEMCTLSTSEIVAKAVPFFRSLEKPIFSNDHALRRLAAHAYGILASHPSCPVADLKTSFETLTAKIGQWKSAIGAEVNKVDGALLALAYFISRSHYRTPRMPEIQNAVPAYASTVIEILDITSDNSLKEVTYESLSQLCMFGVITPTELSTVKAVPTIIEQLLKHAKTGNEKAIATLGHLSMIFNEETDSEVLQTLGDRLYSLHEIRQAETQFAVGEAIGCLVSGWESSALSVTFDMDGPLSQSHKRDKTRSEMINRVLEGCAASKPALKKAAVIWLLCFLQFCGSSSEVQDQLPRFQAAFKRCLSDRDELVQESASRGLGLVYERGGRGLKDDLVRDLVSSFSSNRADLSGTVTEDTQLFEPGALPTGDGSITTYKDIMSLASEVGDSSLVYRFMSLASNNAIWSSRAAFGRFGLSNVLSDSSVDGYLAENPKLYPKLYRYRFDPNSGVRKSMNDIWNALVKDSAGTINTHFDAILEDLLVNIVSREWRVRQACCAAVADLVQGREQDKFSSYMDRIWSLCFKVLDDIKDSVRTAAASLARVLLGILIRSLEANNGSAPGVLKTVLPFLLSTSGIESRAEEVKALSLHTLLEIIKKSNRKTLGPFIPELVEQLLGLLSTFEPEMVNYLYLNASKYKVQESEIDDIRLKGIRSSPLMEAIERCLDLLDEVSMKALATKLHSALRASVGMPSKVGCSRVLVSLSTRHNVLFKPYADRFLKVLEKYVKDRNETVGSAYAASMGYIARGASDQQILALANFAQTIYLEAEDDRTRAIPGDIVHAVAKYATDRFKSLAASFLPFVFFARQDENEHVRHIFEQTWEEVVGGPRAASLYLKEILDLVSSQLSSPRWVLKHAAALAVAEAVASIAASRGEIDEAEAAMLWPPLVKAMADKTWDGKERVLEAFVTFVEKGEAFVGPRKECQSEVVKIAKREAKRRNAAYQQAALPSLARVAATLDGEDLSEAAYEIADPIIREGLASSSTGEADGMEIDRDEQHDLLVAAAVECMLGSINARTNSAHDPAFHRRIGLALASTMRANQAASGAVFAAVSAASNKLLLRLLAVPELLPAVLSTTVQDRTNYHAFASLLFGPAADAKPEALRLGRSEAILALAKAASLLPGSAPELRAFSFQEGLATHMAVERALPVRRNLELASSTLHASSSGPG